MIEQRSQEWFAQRKGMVTCSRLYDAILHDRKYWEELIGLRDGFAGNVATDWGTRCEAEAINEYETATGALALPSGFVKHPSIHWLGGSPDGLVGQGIVLEAKCPYSRVIPEFPPDKYLAQCQGLLAVTQRDEAHLFYWTPTATKLFVINRDREWWASAYDRLAQFWTYVETKTWPPSNSTQSQANATPKTAKKRNATSSAASSLTAQRA